MIIGILSNLGGKSPSDLQKFYDETLVSSYASVLEEIHGKQDASWNNP